MTCMTYRPYGSMGEPLVCVREIDGKHIGRHYGFEDQLGWQRVWVWDEGGASGFNRDGSENIQFCAMCDTPMLRNAMEKVCFHCRMWDARIEDYAGEQTPKQYYIRPHNDEGFFVGKPYLYCWSEGTHGAFGERSCLVRTDTGREFGPSDSLWGSGHIPWWLEDRFQPNGVILFDTIPGFKN